MINETQSNIEDLEFDLKHSQYEGERAEAEIMEVVLRIQSLQEHLATLRAEHTNLLMKRGEIYKQLEQLRG